MKGKPQYRGPATRILLLKLHPVIKFGGSYRSVCIRYSNLMLRKTSRDSVLIRTIYYPFLCTFHSLALCTFKTYYQRMLILAFLLTDQTH